MLAPTTHAEPGTEKVAEALYTVGYWLIGAERFDDGKFVLRSMLRTSPSDERGWIALALCHERTGELEKSDRILALARRACPRSGAAALARARFFERVGRTSEAEDDFDLAIEIATEEGNDDLATAISLERNGR